MVKRIKYQLSAFPTGTQRTMGFNSLLDVDPSLLFLLLLNTTVAPLRAHWQTQNHFIQIQKPVKLHRCFFLTKAVQKEGNQKRMLTKGRLINLIKSAIVL